MARLRRFGLLALLAATAVIAFILLKPEGELIPGPEGLDGAAENGASISGGGVEPAEIDGGNETTTERPTPERPQQSLIVNLELVGGQPANRQTREEHTDVGAEVTINVASDADGHLRLFDDNGNPAYGVDTPITAFARPLTIRFEASLEAKLSLEFSPADGSPPTTPLVIFVDPAPS